MRMSNAPTDTDDGADSRIDPPTTPLDDGQYGHLSLDNGEVVIYDREEPEMWLQSDFAVDLGA